MRVFALTKLGKDVTRNYSGDSDEELRILQYIRENKTATDGELDVVGERWMVRNLKSRGLVKELTS